MYTVYEAISPVVDKMEPKERGIIVAYLLYGKDLKEKSFPVNRLIRLGSEFNTSQIAELINDAFTSGFGILDIITSRDDNYGKQLDICINEVLCKALVKSKPRFRYSFQEWNGIIEREKWIVDAFMERFWDGLKEKEKLELLNGIEDELRKAGINYEILVKRIMQGQATFTLLRTALGFQFHIFLAQISNFIARSIFGRGLSLATNAALQRIAATILGGPVGWTIFFLTIIATVTNFINPKEWDKFIPVVFLIGLYRTYLIELDEKSE